MEGSVTISLRDYEKLVSSTKEADTRVDDSKIYTKELQVFLSYICSIAELHNLIDEFNRQSTTSTIVVESGRARIKLKE